tara:strand:- start:3624 stop:4118 length:495 start_codon:yes stop_codon:yes gene_type:complete
MITINKKFNSVFSDMINEEERYQQNELDTYSQLSECSYHDGIISSARKSLDMIKIFKKAFQRNSKFHVWINLGEEACSVKSYNNEFKEMLENEQQYYEDYSHQAWCEDEKKRFKLIKMMIESLLYQLTRKNVMSNVSKPSHSRKDSMEIRYINEEPNLPNPFAK